MRFGLCAASLFGLALSSATAAETIRVEVKSLAFAPVQLSAHIGDTIEWANSDFVVHTATARDNTFNVIIPAKGSGRVTLQKAGVFDYYCRFHPNMKGNISVSAE